MRPIAIRFMPGLFALAVLSGCSGTIDQAIDDVLPKREATYKSSRSLPPLEIPPDLSSSSLNDTLQVPQAGARGGAVSGGGSATYSGYTSATQQVAAVGNSGVLPDLANARVERSGDKRWLVVEASPSQVWPRVRDFWLAQGFLIEMEDASIGIMETDWAEQRAPIRTGFIRGMLDKMSSAFYGVSTRDKYRTRLERGASGATEVYVSHRGAEEVIKEGASSQPSAARERSWQPRAADPELEAEMLTRLMVSFGIAEEAAEQRVAGSEPRRDRAQMQRDGGGSVLTLNESFSRAWRRTGLALDRVGFTVEDRDRSRGLYFVRYVDPDKDVKGKQEQGMFSKLAFWRDDSRDTSKDAYLISLIGGSDDTGDTQVVVLNKEGEREASATAERILSLLHDQLR